MMIITLDEIKRNSRILGNDEDDYLTQCGDGAEETVANYLGRGKGVDAMLDSLVQEYGYVPVNVKRACLLLADIAYNHRSPITPGNMSVVPYGNIENLLKPYMIL